MAQQSMSVDRMAADLATTAELAGVKNELSAIQRVLDTFKTEFETSPVEFRTTTRPVAERGLSFRFVELGRPMDPFRTAVDSGLIVMRDRPVERIVPEVQKCFPIQGYGVDSDLRHGLEKVWPFLSEAPALRRVSEIPSFPLSVRATIPFCEKYGLTHFSIIAADYQYDTCNLYFMVKQPGKYTRDVVTNMCADLGYAAPPDSLLAHYHDAVAVNLTFNWSSPGVERLCFYTPAPEPRMVPTAIHPVLETLVARTPIASDHRSFIVGWTFRRQDCWLKLEIDYTGTVLPVLQRCVGVPLAA
jgi:hypothetical protein